MKLPFDFGIKLVFRLLIPGFFLTLGFWPALYILVRAIGRPIPSEYAFLLCVLLLGWIIVLSDMLIYMLFEGRRFWPGFLLGFFVGCQETRLSTIEGTITGLETIKKEKGEFTDTQLQKYREANFDRRKFPIGNDGRYTVASPSRLGNILAAYEGYPSRVYGMDSVFYWYRIWLVLDKDLRDEIESQQAIADSAVYTSFALFVSGFLFLIYAIISKLHLLVIPSLPNDWILWPASLVALLIGYLVYRTSIHVHAQFGETFKSVFDIHQKDIDISQVVEQVSKLTNDPSLAMRTRKEQLRVAWRYLQYYLVRCKACGGLVSAADLRGHKCSTPQAVEGGSTPTAASPCAVERSQSEHSRQSTRP